MEERNSIMFERFDTWIIIGIAVVMLFCGIDAWITSLYRRNKEQAGEIRRLRHALHEKEAENTWLLARCESKTDQRVLYHVQKNDDLRELLEAERVKNKELQTLLDQKWAAASNQTGKAAKSK